MARAEYAHTERCHPLAAADESAAVPAVSHQPVVPGHGGVRRLEGATLHDQVVEAVFAGQTKRVGETAASGRLILRRRELVHGGDDAGECRRGGLGDGRRGLGSGGALNGRPAALAGVEGPGRVVQDVELGGRLVGPVPFDVV
jgi:hypothetical protein